MKNKIVAVRIIYSTKYTVAFVREDKDGRYAEKQYTPKYFGRVDHINFLLEKYCNAPLPVLGSHSMTLHYEPKPARKEFFDVLRVSRADFEEQGYDASKLSDSDMQEIANYLGDNESSMEGFWDSIDFAAERFDVPKTNRAKLADVERERIKVNYERASILSNTDPIAADLMFVIAREDEHGWYMENYSRDLIEADEAIMPDSFYLDVVPLIKSRAAAARRGQE